MGEEREKESKWVRGSEGGGHAGEATKDNDCRHYGMNKVVSRIFFFCFLFSVKS